MKKIYVLLSLCTMLAVTTSTYLLVHWQEILCQNHTEKSSEGVIDILSLCKTDYAQIFRGEYNEVFLAKGGIRKQVYYGRNPLRTVALSPSGKQVAFYYFPNDRSVEELSLILFNRELGTTRQIQHTQSGFWDVTSDIYWLGNNHIFFTRYCGTNCKGITLLNVESGQTTNAVLSYPSFSDQPERTHFKDWFGREFVFDGLVNSVRSKASDGKSYLVFDLIDYNGNSVGEKKIPFSL